MREVQFYKDFTRKTDFFFFFPWFMFNNSGLLLGMALKFYSGVARRLKLKVREFWELIPTLGEVTREKLVGVGLFEILNRVKIIHANYQLI